MRQIPIIRALRRLRRQDDGAALVEFGLVLPLMLLVFAVSIESARTFWSYQATIAGVRDAARYVGRAVQNDICLEGGDLTAIENAATIIVREASDGTTLFPSSITVDRVFVDLTCHAGSYRMSSTPVARVSAELNISYPFQAFFTFVGVDLLPASTVIRDQQRIFGA